MTRFRTERDSMGELKVPAKALYGAQTQRAVDNFPVSGLTMPREFIRALGLIKSAAAEANVKLGHLDKASAKAGTPSAAANSAKGREPGFRVTTCQRSLIAVDAWSFERSPARTSEDLPQPELPTTARKRFS